MLDVVETTLSNGLRVRLIPDAAVPTCSLYLFFRVGTRNERPGLVGISHLFEHMYFNGAKKYGRGAFDRVMEANGGDSNAYTTHDETMYHETFPTEALETVLDLEADRMRSLRISEDALERERRVVLEERRSRVDDDVAGLLAEELDALAYRVHPYRWPVVGLMKDVAGIRKQDCDAFFRTYYAPNNATVFLSGDFQPRRALQWVRRAFGDIPRGPGVPEVPFQEPEQLGERRSWVRRPAQAPWVYVSYPGPAGAADDALALDLLQFALSVGESCRLIRELVFKRKAAVNATMDWTWRIDPGQLAFSLELKPGARPERAEALLDDVLARAVETRMSPRELDKARNNLRVALWRELATVESRAATCATHEAVLGSWRSIERVQERYDAFTAEDVRAAGERYLRRDRKSAVTLIPEAVG